MPEFKDTITIGMLSRLLERVKARTGDPSIIVSLRPDGSGAVESVATKEIYAVWLDTAELNDILEAN